jgi:hypothetical protein
LPSARRIDDNLARASPASNGHGGQYVATHRKQHSAEAQGTAPVRLVDIELLALAVAIAIPIMMAMGQR